MPSARDDSAKYRADYIIQVMEPFEIIFSLKGVGYGAVRLTTIAESTNAKTEPMRTSMWKRVHRYWTQYICVPFKRFVRVRVLRSVGVIVRQHLH